MSELNHLDSILKTLDRIPIIKYIIYKEDKKHHVSYSQFHDIFLNHDKNQTLDTKINQDLKWYKNSLLKKQKEDQINIKVFVDNELYKEISL